MIGCVLPWHGMAPNLTQAQTSPKLDTLTGKEADRLFNLSLGRLCSAVNRSRHRGTPIASECGPWPGMQVPAASMLGIVLLGEGNTLKRGPHAATLRKLFAYVRQAGPAPHASIDRYRTWVVSFSLMFLSEMHRTIPSATLKKQLQRMAVMLEAGAYPDGGWGHTLQRELNNYPAFTASTVWAVAALKSAQAQGVTVNEKQLQQNIDWLRATIGKSGGSGYSVKNRFLVSPGRTSATAWVLDRWDAKASAKQVKSAAAFIQAHVKFTPEGHSSGMMNFGWGALASRQIGGDLATSFFKTHASSLYTARKADGTFTVQPWRDISFPDRGPSKPFEQPHKKPNADESAGDGWAAVWMLTSWQAARGKSLLCGDEKEVEK